MITKEVDYAIRAVLCLAQNKDAAIRLSAAEIAQKMDIPYRFLRNIVRMLVDAGIVDSRRGNGGGLSLLKSPGDISVYDVIQTINPKSCTLNECLLGQGRCRRDNICRVHHELVGLQDIVDSQLKELRFDKLIK